MNNWPKTISRLSSVEVIGVDDLLGSLPTEPGLVRDVDPDAVNEACIPHKALWADMLSTEHMTLGVIVSSTILKPASVAAQLASMAMERSIEPIIFSRIGMCGLERFGFRVEDTSATDHTSSSTLENQLSSFWNITVSIDVEQLSILI
jgi:hypothetical protein